jgi:branched-chain amino acid transport system permease protein
LLGFSFNPKLIEVLGYNPKLIRIFVFFTSSILTGTASIISAFDIGFDPHVGLSIVLISAVALIIGGVKIFEGAILGAFLIGILQSIVIWKLSARWVDAFVFLLFIIFLLFKPTGLLGKKLRVEEIR